VLAPRSADNVIKFDSTKFAEQRFRDALDIPYYLSRGEPNRAYQCLLHSEVAGGSANSTQTIMLSLSAMTALMATVRRVAFENVQNQTVLSACVCFLDLCDLNSHELRVDAAAAHRIISDNSADAIAAGATNWTSRVVTAFMSFAPSSPSSPSQQTPVAAALELLVAATTRLVDGLPKTSVDRAHAWRLVTEFCFVHQLPLSQNILIELARRSDWVAFLHDAQLLGYHPQEVINALAAFDHVGIRDHISEAVHRLARASHVKPTDPSPSLDVDVFNAFMAASSRIYPGEMLLQQAMSSKKPMLAVLGLLYPDVTALSCLIVWLNAAGPFLCRFVTASFYY
jgi:hypothetical protein